MSLPAEYGIRIEFLNRIDKDWMKKAG